MMRRRLCQAQRNVFKCDNSIIEESIFYMWLREPIVPTPTIDVSRANSVVLYANNLEQLPISICLQHSSNGRYFVNDSQILCLGSGEAGSIVPSRLSEFMRAVVVRNSYINRNYGCNSNSRAKLWFIVEQ